MTATDVEYWTALATVALAVFTFLLFIGTATLAVYTYKLFKATNTLATDSKEGSAQQVAALLRSASAMERTVALADHTAICQLRAYLTVSVGVFTDQNDAKGLRFQWTPRVTNTGQTPAQC